jgi:hypothetical protein
MVGLEVVPFSFGLSLAKVGSTKTKQTKQEGSTLAAGHRSGVLVRLVLS